MDTEEILHIIQNAGEFTNMSTLAYREGQLLGSYSPFEYANGYVEIYLDQILREKNPVSIFYTDENLYLGIVNMHGYILVIGPASEVKVEQAQAKRIADLVGCSTAERDGYIRSLLLTPCVPISTIALMMCIGYHQCTGIKLNAADVLRNSVSSEERDSWRVKDQWNSLLELDETMLKNETLHHFEREYCKVIRMGSEEDMEKLIQDFAIDIPKKGPNQVRHYKNTFIMATTLASRVVVDVGAPAPVAFALADYYMNRCENLVHPDAVTELMSVMMKHFTRLSRQFRSHHGESSLLSKVNEYIQLHISERITVQQMAYDLGMSRNSLSGNFKRETGEGLAEFILKQKIERAKYILATTDYSFAEISSLLAFSSQSHFQRTFKQYEKMTPREFRRNQ